MLAKELAKILLEHPDAEIFVLEDSRSPMFDDRISVMYRKFDYPDGSYHSESIHISSPTYTKKFIPDFVELK